MKEIRHEGAERPAIRPRAAAGASEHRCSPLARGRRTEVKPDAAMHGAMVAGGGSDGLWVGGTRGAALSEMLPACAKFERTPKGYDEASAAQGVAWRYDKHHAGRARSK